MAKELVLVPKKKYEELMQNKQTDLTNSTKDHIDQQRKLTENLNTLSASDGHSAVQSGEGLIVRQRLVGKGLPGISNRLLQKSKKPTKKKKKTKIRWLKF